MGTFAAFFASNDRLFVFIFSFEDIFHIMDLTVFSSVTEEFFHLSQGKLYYLPEKTAFFLIMLLIYLFITLTVDYDYWYAPFLSLMAYFMMLTVFRKKIYCTK